MRGRRVRPGVAGDFFVSACGGASGADAGAIDAPEFPVDVPVLVELDLQGLDDGGEDAALTPLAEVVVHRLPGAEAFRQVPPRGAGGEDPEDTVELRSSIAGRTSCPGRAAWQMRFDQRPLLIRELVAFHGYKIPRTSVFRQSLRFAHRRGPGAIGASAGFCKFRSQRGGALGVVEIETTMARQSWDKTQI